MGSRADRQEARSHTGNGCGPPVLEVLCASRHDQTLPTAVRRSEIAKCENGMPPNAPLLLKSRRSRLPRPRDEITACSTAISALLPLSYLAKGSWVDNETGLAHRIADSPEGRLQRQHRPDSDHLPPAPSASNCGRIAPDVNELSLMRQRQRGCATEAAVHIGPSAIARVGEAPVTHNLR